MAAMGKYCKAYQLFQLRDYPMWVEKVDNEDSKSSNSDDTEKTILDGDSVVYIQENYVVTSGVYMDEDILFDTVDDDWTSYCHNHLGFGIPEYVIEAEKVVEKDWDDFAKEEEARRDKDKSVEDISAGDAS